MAAAKKTPLCTPKYLPRSKLVRAAQLAIDVNPANAPSQAGLAAVLSTAIASVGDDPSPEVLDRLRRDLMSPQRVAVLTTKYWGAGGVKLTVSFMEAIKDDLAGRILSHMNAWSTEAGANVQFARTSGRGDVRITREEEGYWSYVGTDIKQIPRSEATMCLEGFAMSTPEAEYRRVVRHETGHTLGMTHEHLRRDVVARLDVEKTIAYFRDNYGWSEEDTRYQVLTPVEEKALLAPTAADTDSVMCYQLPGEITTDGRPIPGGLDMDERDREYARKVYPPAAPPPPPPRKDRTLVVRPDGTLILDGKVV